MLAVFVNANNYVTAFDVMTQATYVKTRIGQPGWYFVDRTVFYSDAEVAQFMSQPQSYYIDAEGVLRYDYGDSTNNVNLNNFFT